ncbi:MAG: histidine phosphatase family protein [Jatrophihabitans sp.]|uniref:histidine phosphatase family protein n=1 Tax=Jatrophihabitans sp. TaxID=1932789 RepID=UPI003F7D5AD7
MGRILLVRHGQASFGADDYDALSDRGFEQSGMLGAALAARGVRPDVIVRGGMLRHEQTLTALVDAAGWTADVQVDAGWNEYDHVDLLSVADSDPRSAAAEGMSVAEVFDRALARWSESGMTDYAEPFAEFSTRVEAAARSVMATLGRGGTAVVVSSGGPISWVVAGLLAAGPPTWRRLNTTTVNTGITTVAVGRRGPSVISINEHTHLAGELITYR